ncbi:type II toxin-antitoxin system PemK/MazF family toxin [Microbacterium sp. SS28]|uniref:type II toxin-antitoxin system PemK/MazF family toxin n=1 Tax=Microbacterium sp. SS28 TaxID=2919948 RepID=UPI001FAAD15A|nr:type II toxin-antitoxin system PemK/MazF family toxin [Microbacterium sp. SS28]
MSPRPSLLSALKSLLRPSARAARPTVPTARPVGASDGGEGAGRLGASATTAVEPPPADGLRIAYAPDHDGDPDAGEIVWTWVPYAENDGRGKDRPVLVIGRADGSRVFAVRLTSKSHDGDRDFLALGAGPWDTQGRPSWVDIEQLYSVHGDGMRREAAALDPERFHHVARALRDRYGWEIVG